MAAIRRSVSWCSYLPFLIILANGNRAAAEGPPDTLPRKGAAAKGRGELVFTLRGHTNIVWGVAFSPDGKLLASASGPLLSRGPGEIKLWNAATGKERFSLRGHTDRIKGGAFSPGKMKPTYFLDKAELLKHVTRKTVLHRPLE
jgi:WD40 repeat protein